METDRKSRNLIFGTTTTILVVFLGILGWQFVEQKNAAEQAQLELAGLTLRDSLVYEFNVLKYEYKTVSSQNQGLRDELKEQSEQITNLITEIDQLENSNNDAKLILAYQKLSNLKRANYLYVNRIDKINREKEVLLAENNTLRTDLNIEKEYTKELENHIKVVDPLAIIGKPTIKKQKLGIKSFSAVPIKYNIEHKEVVASRAAKTEKISICFTTEQNDLIKIGRKTAYINIYSPTGTLITKAAEGFNYKGGDKNFTLKSVFSYQNKETDVCSYWYITKEYIPGTYKSELIIDSEVISTSEFSLR